MANKKTPRETKLQTATSENWTPVDNQPGVYHYTGSDKVDWEREPTPGELEDMKPKAEAPTIYPDCQHEILLSQILSEVDDNTACWLPALSDPTPFDAIADMLSSIPGVGNTRVFLELSSCGITVVSVETEKALFSFSFTEC